MNGYKWAIFVLYILSGLSTVLLIGKPRKPTTPGVAAISLCVSAATLVLVYRS